jgi:hypothetical protein
MNLRFLGCTAHHPEGCHYGALYRLLVDRDRQDDRAVRRHPERSLHLSQKILLWLLCLGCGWERDRVEAFLAKLYERLLDPRDGYGIALRTEVDGAHEFSDND